MVSPGKETRIVATILASVETLAVLIVFYCFVNTINEPWGIAKAMILMLTSISLAIVAFSGTTLLFIYLLIKKE